MRRVGLPFRSTPPCRAARRVARIRPRVVERRARLPTLRAAKKLDGTGVVEPVREEDVFSGLTAILDTVKWSKTENLVPVIVQHVDTGELLMQAYADRAAISETLQTKVATFYSRSRESRWCKGETSGNYIHVSGIYLDCDRDSVVYLGDPTGPSCHTGARTCWFHEVRLENRTRAAEEHLSPRTSLHAPRTTLHRLEDTIEARRAATEAPEGQASWTAKLLADQDLLCSKILEEAQELCDALKKKEGAQRTTEEMADVLYHCLVLLNKEGVRMEDVLRVLRGRFGTSGIEEKAGRRQGTEC